MIGGISLFFLGLTLQGSEWDVHSIYSRALLVSPSSRSALQKVTEARAHVAEMMAQRNLQVTANGTLSGSQGRLDSPPSTETFHTIQGSLTVPIPNMGRIGAQINQSRAQLQAAEAGLHRSRLDLAFRSNDAYFGVLRTRGAEVIAEQNLAQAQRQVADAQKRVDAGDLAQSDVLKAQVPESQATVALARAKSAERLAELTLLNLVQTPVDEAVALVAPPPMKSLDFTQEQAIAEARQNSPDVQEAQANLMAAQSAVAIAGHGRDPDFSLQATEAHTNDPTTYSRLTTLSFSVNLPLSDGGVAREQVNQAKAQLAQAKSALALAVQTTDLAVQGAYLDVQLNSASVESTKDTLRIATESYTKAEQAYAAGLTTTRDVLDAGLTLTQAKSDVNAAEYDLAVSRAKLEQTIGREMEGTAGQGTGTKAK